MLTADRRVLTPGEVTERSADEALWWLGWRHKQQLVVISNDADIEVEATDAEEVRIVDLPRNRA